MKFLCKFLILLISIAILVFVVLWCLEDPTRAKKSFMHIAEKSRKLMERSQTSQPVSVMNNPEQAKTAAAARIIRHAHEPYDPDGPIALEDFGKMLDSQLAKKNRRLSEMN